MKNERDYEVIADDEPVTLAEACKLFFGGRLTKSALRTEARKGNLEVLMIAGKAFVTRNAIERMKEKCLVKNNQQGSGSDQTPKHGSSRTETGASAQNAARLKLQLLKESLPNTSPANTSRGAEVARLR